MPNETNLTFWLILWAVAVASILLVRLRTKATACGLVFAYIFNLWAIHWVAASLYIMPWYSGDWLAIWYRGFHSGWVEDGFKLSTYGIVAFAVGVLFLAPHWLKTLSAIKQEPFIRVPDPRLPRAYIVTGLLFFFFLPPGIRKIPTISTIVSSGLNLAAIGFALAAWKSWQDKKFRKFYRIIITGIVSLPVLTLVTQGFVSFGAAAVLGILAFVASFFRPLWKLIMMTLLVGYLGLSIYVTYMRDREPIRESVWGGEEIAKRVSLVYQTFSNFEWFSLSNEAHLRRVDQRLNQNLLVGAAMENIPSNQDYVHGETFWTAIIVLIPRPLWPDKPGFLGGSNLASRLTGLNFLEETTIGIGEVMEFYANFGILGVVVGFLCVGVVVALFDSMARKHLLRGDWQGFTLWFLPGLSLVQVHDSLVAVIGGAVAGIVMAIFINQMLGRFRGRKLFLWKRPG